MKKSSMLLGLPCILLMTAISCSKNSDTTKPLITVNSPQNNQTFANGQTIQIDASISDESELHGVHIMVINQTTGGHVMHEEYHPDTKTYALKKSFTAQTGGVYKIEIGAEDHNQNEITVQLQVNGQ